jgi:hypothetical protein
VDGLAGFTQSLISYGVPTTRLATKKLKTAIHRQTALLFKLLFGTLFTNGMKTKHEIMTGSTPPTIPTIALKKNTQPALKANAKNSFWPIFSTSIESRVTPKLSRVLALAKRRQERRLERLVGLA